MVCLFAPLAAMAFNKERCGRLFPQSDGDHPYFYSPIYVSTMFPSTTSYFSSLGPCSMYGDSQTTIRASFIENERSSIRVDAARGDGEYLRTLAQLSGCSDANYPAVATAMQREFAAVFGPSAHLTIDQVVHSVCR